MSPLDPIASFGHSHVLAQLVMGVHAVAEDIRSLASDSSQARSNMPVAADDLHYALLGLAALGDHVEAWARAPGRSALLEWPSDPGASR